MNGHDHSRPVVTGVVVQIGGREPRLPIMRVHDIGREHRDRALAQRGRPPAQCGETLRIVGPIRPVRPGIWAARASKQVRCIERDHIQPGRATRAQPCLGPEQIGEAMNLLGRLQRFQNLRITGD